MIKIVKNNQQLKTKLSVNKNKNIYKIMIKF